MEKATFLSSLIEVKAKVEGKGQRKLADFAAAADGKLHGKAQKYALGSQQSISLLPLSKERARKVRSMPSKRQSKQRNKDEYRRTETLKFFGASPRLLVFHYGEFGAWLLKNGAMRARRDGG